MEGEDWHEELLLWSNALMRLAVDCKVLGGSGEYYVKELRHLFPGMAEQIDDRRIGYGGER